MWPDLMGPGWELQIAMSVGLLLGLIVVVALLGTAAFRVERDAPDALLQLWHRYEEGDLTPGEFERLKRAAATNRDRPGSPRRFAVSSDAGFRGRTEAVTVDPRN